jgi:diguanylate cyclase (GGDEF)-like protein
LKRLAIIDDLTQVANRRRLEDYLQKEWKRGIREKISLSVILCDIDFFKQYNDTYGHVIGDECLKQVAQAINQAVKRPADLVARYGGEEFMVILPNTPLEGALKVARDIQKTLQSFRIIHDASSINQYITLSIGLANTIPESIYQPITLIKAADSALYKAKQNGRNCIITEYL